MADPTLSTALHRVHRLFGTTGCSPLSDSELLDSFLGGRDEEAFAVLARRHGPMVLGVCRRVLRHEQDAEEAFQATFLVLARKAASVRDRAVLASWLHGTAYRAASTLGRSLARRRHHEEQYRPGSPPNPLDEIANRETQTILEEEIQRLPEMYRTVFVLCCLENLSRAEVAGRLGLEEGTVCSRLDRARKLLRQRLARRALELPSGPVSPCVVPPALLQATTTALADRGQTATAGVVKLAALVEAGVRVTAWWKLSVVVLLTAGVVGTWIGLAATPPVPDSPSEAAVGAPELRERVAEVLAAPRDAQGDPLPPGVLARLGTTRFRHGSTVTGLAFAADGKSLVSASYDRTLRVWDPGTGKELRRVPSLSGSINELAVAADGNRVAVVDHGGLYLGELKAGRCDPLTFQASEVYTCVALSPDGRWLAAGNAEGIVRLAEVSLPRAGRQYRMASPVRRLAFARDGKTLAACSRDGAAVLWDVKTGKERLRLTRERAVQCLAFSPDGELLATGGEDGKVSLWRLATGKLAREFQSGRSGLETLSFSPDGKTLAASGGGNAIQFWEVATGKLQRRIWVNPTVVVFSPDGRTLASGGSDCTIRLWDVATGKERAVEEGHRSPVRQVAVSRDGKVASCGGDRVIRLWDIATGKLTRQFEARTPYLPRMALSGDGKRVASNYCIWDTANGKELGRFGGQDYSIEAMGFSPDGTTLAMAGEGSPGPNRRVRLWEVARFQVVGELGTLSVHSLAFHPNGKMLATGNADGTVSLREVPNGREVHRLSGHRREVNAVAFSPDGSTLASTSFDGDLFLWNTETAQQLRACVRDVGHGRRTVNILSVAFAPNGRMLATSEAPFTSSEGASITLWEVATGRVRLRLKGHEGDVNSLAFTHDGRALVSGSTDTTVLVWDVRRPLRNGPGSPAGALWEDLLAEDAPRAYRAIRDLAVSAGGVRLLGKHLSPVPTLERSRLTRLLEDLDGDEAAVRNRAQEALEKLGEAAEPAVWKALAGRPSAEVRRRLERVREKLEPEWLRTRRALEALELAGTPHAKAILRVLARGVLEARLTREAEAILARGESSKP